MPSYGAVDKPSSDAESNAAQVPRAHSYQELDMRFLEKDEVPESDRRRKLISTWVPILVALAFVLIFAKVALVAIGPAQHDPNFPEYGSKAAPATSTEEAPVSPPYSHSYSHTSEDGTKTKEYSYSYESEHDTEGTSTGGWCSDYKACDKLGLIGLCCPTGEGVMLGCCK